MMPDQGFVHVLASSPRSIVYVKLILAGEERVRERATTELVS
jgi:hypothetical protein